MAAVGERNPVARWQRSALDAALVALAVTGIAWLLAHYLYGAGNEAVGLPHPAEPWLIRVHGLAAFVALIVFGAFLPAHVPRGWRMQPRRRVEIALIAALAAAIVTAYVLYYFAPDTVRPALGWIHAAVGVAGGLALVLHRWRRYANATRR